MKIKVEYPSGKKFTVEGKFTGLTFVGNEGGVLVENDKSAFILDPRGIYSDTETNKILYNPRDYLSIFGGTTIWVFDWLNENPSWGLGR